MNHYELLYIIPLKMGEETAEPIIKKISDRLRELGGETTLDSNLGKRKLAYPIKQVRYGFYVLLEFNISAEALKILERELQLDSNVIRFQIIRKKIKSDETIAREQALQEKLKTQRAHEDMVEAEAKLKPKSEPKIVTKIDDLDKKLDEILENQIVK